MSQSEKSLYHLRDRLHQFKGAYTEEELLKRILHGKYQGEEEVSLPPYTEWQRLSTIPIFYDAFLRRLYQKGTPQSEIHQDSDRKDPKGPDKVTRHEKPRTEVLELDMAPAPEPEAWGHTQNLKEVGATIHQADIDELMGESAAGEQPLGLDIDHKMESSTAELAVPTELKSNSLEPRKATSVPLRRIFLYGGLILFLILLFQVGDKSQPSLVDKAPEKEDKASTSPDATDSKLSADEDTLLFLKKEGADYLQTDTAAGYSQAVKDYRILVSANPTDGSGYVGLATALARSLEDNPKNEKILAELNRTIEQGRQIEPQLSAYYRAEAIASLARGEKNQAQEAADKAVEADSLSAENFLVQAEILTINGQFPEAQKLLQAVLSENQNLTRAYILVTQILLKQGDGVNAAQAASYARALSPARTEAYTLLGDALVAQNKILQARAMYEVGAKLAPFATRKIAAYAHWRTGNLYEVENNKTVAEKHYQLARYYWPEIDPKLKEKLKSPLLSELEIKKLREALTFDKEKLLELAQDQWAQRKYADALKYYLATNLLYPKDVSTLLHLGETREKLAKSVEDFQIAAQTYRAAIEADPQDARPYLRLGQLETEQSNFDKGMEYLMRAEALAPEEATVQLALGKHLLARKEYRGAGARLQRALMYDPNNSEVTYYQGLLYKALSPENPREPMRLFQEAYTKNAENYDALAEWLKLKVVTYDKMFAVKFLRNLLEVEPKNPQLYWAFGEIYSANKEFLRAVTYYHRSLDIDNRAPKVRMSLARALAAVGKLDEAVAEFKLASDLDVKNGDGYFEAAGIYYEGKNYKLAEESLNTLLKVSPNYPGARRRLSLVYRALNQKEASIAEMKKEVKSNPMNFQYAIELSELYMGYEMYPDAAKELGRVTVLPLEKRVEDKRSPTGIRKDPTGYKPLKIKALLLLSRCNRAMNRADTAEGAIKAAIDIDGNDPELRRERGYVYHALERDREAADDFRMYLSRIPNAPDAETIKEIIKKTLIED